MKTLRQMDPALGKILPAAGIDPRAAYVPSRFAFLAEGVRFHLVTREMVSLARPLPEGISGAEILADAEWKALAERYFLVPREKDETAFYLGIFRILHALVRKRGVGGYTILPTAACNARCVYCFEQGMKPVTMTREILDKTVEYILRTRRQEGIWIQWFGGEPLLRADLIDEICDRLRDSEVSFSSSVVTNGSLVTGEMAARMAEMWNLKSAQVSMDGNEADYRARKRYLREGDAYHTVLRGIRSMAERGIHVTVRCNVDADNLDGVEDFLRDLSDAVPREQADVGLCLLNESRTGDQGPDLWRRLIALRPMLARYGFSADSRYTLQNLRNFHCMADLGSVVIGADGGLYACEHCTEASRFGSVADGLEDQERRERFCSLSGLREKCRECPFLPACTPFAACPVQEKKCREIREILLREQIRSYLAGENPEAADGAEYQEC